MWSRRAQEYEAKINSGDIKLLTEVVRDLFRSDSQPEQSYSERQLYEAALEGLFLGIILIIFVYFFKLLKYPGRIMGTFFFGYGLARIFVEFFREADPQYITTINPNGYILMFSQNLGFSMGQVLSLPMLVIGLIFIILSFKKTNKKIS